jgi:2-polyprenyl-3-methyl-5-hydroxy-6-metoxy-1,4-benzoquinol methylase
LGIDAERVVQRIDQQQGAVIGRVDVFQHQITYGYLEPTHELLDLTLRSLNRLEGSVEALNAAAPLELSQRTYALLNYEKSHLGFQAQAGLWMNHPIALEYTPDEVRWVYTNERVVEIPWVLQGLSALKPPARVLDIGPLESLVSLQLASCGYKVTALDVRPYRFSHPNLNVVVAGILEWRGNGAEFDAVILLSTLEHIGLGVYGQAEGATDADVRTMNRVRELLRKDGILILTTPFGRSRVDATQRVYSGEDMARLLKGFRTIRCALASRVDSKTWNMDITDFDALCRLQVLDDTERVALVVAERE